MAGRKVCDGACPGMRLGRQERNASCRALSAVSRKQIFSEGNGSHCESKAGEWNRCVLWTLFLLPHQGIQTRGCMCVCVCVGGGDGGWRQQRCLGYCCIPQFVTLDKPALLYTQED